MTFMAWPEIEQFHQVKKYLQVDPTEWWRMKETLSGTSTVSYKAKCKLHGTNSAIQILHDGTLVCQSRERIITPEDDNAGFARWVKTQEYEWVCFGNIIFYGEWIGQGIQKNVAVSEIGKKVFAIFAARHLDGCDDLIIEPKELHNLIDSSGLIDVYVLPWYQRDDVDVLIDLDWRQDNEALTLKTNQINQWVMDVEKSDPWVKATFNIDGVGEGLVFYPISEAHLGFENFSILCFKAKGEKHKNIATAKPAQVNAESAASIEAFVQLVLTEPRLEQGARTVQLTQGSYDAKQTGKFIQWVQIDIEKETQDELAASNLTFKQVQKEIGIKARQWYLEKVKQ